MASTIVGDMTGATVDDPLYDRFTKLGCSVTPLDKNSDDYQMIVKYLDTTYEPFGLEDVVRLSLPRMVFVFWMIGTWFSPVVVP